MTPDPSEMGELDQAFAALEDALFNTETFSTDERNFQTLILTAQPVCFIEAEDARKIVDLARIIVPDLKIKTLLQETVAAQMAGRTVLPERELETGLEKSLADGTHKLRDGTPILDMTGLLIGLNPVWETVDPDTELTDEQLRLSAMLDARLYRMGHAIEATMIPSFSDSASAEKARALVDEYEGGRKQLIKDITNGDFFAIHPRSTELYAALSTNELDLQMELAAQIDELVHGLAEFPWLPVIGESSRKIPFIAHVGMPFVRYSNFGYGAEILLPRRGDTNAPCTMIVDPEMVKHDSSPATEGWPSMSVLFYDEFRFRTNVLDVFDEGEVPVGEESALPFVSVASMVDESAGYDEGLHRIFRYGFANYMIQLAPSEKRAALRNGEVDMIKRVLRGPWTQEAQIEEVQRFMNIVEREVARIGTV